MIYTAISTRDKAFYNAESTKGLKIFNNSEFGRIRTVEVDGKIYFVANDIAKALGYTNPSKATNDHCRWVTKRYIPHPQSKTKTLEVNIIPEGDVYRLVTHSELPAAEKFESWVFDEVLPTLRKTGTYNMQPTPPIVSELSVVKFVADDLRVSDESRISMYRSFCEDKGISTSFLPNYVDNGNRERSSATELLKRNGCALSAPKFNQLLIEYGFLEEKQRASVSKGVKHYKSLTEKGLQYGVNLINDKNKKETQPYYYADTFMKLYNIVA